MDGLGHSGGVAADGLTGDGHLPGLVGPGDALRSLLHRDAGHGAQRHGAAEGGGNGHGAQGIQAGTCRAVALDHHVQLLVVDGDGGSSGAGELRPYGGAHSGGGEPILGGGLPVHLHLHLRYLLAQRALDFRGVRQLGDALYQVVGDHAQSIVVVAADLHIDVGAAHHAHGAGGIHGDLASGDVLESGAQVVGHVGAAALPLALAHQVHHHGGGFILSDVVHALQLRALLGDHSGDLIGDGGGLIGLRADRHGDGDGYLTLVHVGDQDGLGGKERQGEDHDQSHGDQHTGFEMVGEVGEQTHVKGIELCHCGGGPGGQRAGGLVGLGQLLAADLFLIQQEIAQKGYQRQRDDQRREDQRGDGQAEVPEHHARDAVHQTQRHEHRQRG